jgi:hypothetical protein
MEMVMSGVQLAEVLVVAQLKLLTKEHLQTMVQLM